MAAVAGYRGAVGIDANAEHQRSNWNAQKLKLDADDIAKIDALDEGKRNANPPFAPKW